MKLFLLFVWAGLFFSSTVYSMPAPDSCDFYTQKASALKCSSTNYLVRFGDHYCREFERAEPLFSPEGRGVLNCIRPCLIKALTRPDLSCANVQPIAFASHVKCYVHCGFCEMPPTDQMTIGAVVWREFFDPNFRAVMDEVSRQCILISPTAGDLQK